MADQNLEDFLLDTLAGLAAHHGDQLVRTGNHVQTPDGKITLAFKDLKFGEKGPGNFVILATIQISAPSTGMADLYDSIMEGGPNTDIPLQHGLMEIYHLFQFVQKALTGAAKPDTALALANAEGVRNFNVFSYGPIVRADNDEIRVALKSRLGDTWIFEKVFAGAPSTFTGYRPYWVKVNHLKAGEVNVPECRLDEREWTEVQAQIATFQWPLHDNLMGYKQIFIFMPAGQMKR